MWLLVALGMLAMVAEAKEPLKTKGSAKALRLAAPTVAQVAAARKMTKVRLRVVTTKGTIGLELNGAAAPIAVANFLNLVRAGFYNGMPFHRVEPGFVIQAGEPDRVGRPPAGYTIQDEKSPIRHTKGTIAMARLYRGGQMAPNSGDTQFYITLADTPHLDTLGFTAFGKVVSGMDAALKIAAGDKIVKAEMIRPRGK
jgi:peptidyl-prolyl cis-trans isomerase B (cyclophilin B)